MQTSPEILLFVLTGLLAGSFGGLLGLGGATILVPALTLGFGLPVHMAIAVSLISNVFVSITSAIGYYRRGLIHRKPVLLMNLGSIAGIGIGTFIATRSPDDVIKVLFGLFLLFLIAEAVVRYFAEVARKISRVVEDGMLEPTGLRSAEYSVLGFIMGVLGALLGIGGGAIAVPVQNVLFRIPLRNAIANSLATIIVSASIGAVLYFVLASGHLFSAPEALLTAAAVVPGSVAGAHASTVISDRVPTRYIKFIFYVAILYIAYNMIKSGMGW